MIPLAPATATSFGLSAEIHDYEAPPKTGDANDAYATGLTASLQQPFADVDTMLRATRLTVHQATAGGQTPWHASASATPPFAYPAGATAQQIQAAAAGLPITPAALSSLPADVAYWSAIWRNTAEDDKAYLDAFGTSAPQDQAERIRMLLALLERAQPDLRGRRAGCASAGAGDGDRRGVLSGRLRRLLSAAGRLHGLGMPAAAAAALHPVALGLRAAAAAAVVRAVAPGLSGTVVYPVASGLPGAVVHSVASGLPGAVVHPVASGLSGAVVHPVASGLPDLHAVASRLPGAVVHPVASGLSDAVVRAVASGLSGTVVHPVASGLSDAVVRALASGLSGTVVHSVASRLSGAAVCARGIRVVRAGRRAFRGIQAARAGQC